MVAFSKNSLAAVLAFALPLAMLGACILSMAACSKKATEPAKTATQINAEKGAAEKAAAEKMVRDNPVYGEQIKALDQAKAMQKTLDAATAESSKKIDELTK